MARKTTRRPKAFTPMDESIPAVTPGKDATVGTVIGERADVYTQVPGDPCALTVPSATRPGVVYTVRFHPATGAISCDCPGYLNAKPGKTCRHVATWTPQDSAAPVAVAAEAPAAMQPGGKTYEADWN